MPGPVSDRYDPEWGTADNAEQIREAIQSVYDRLSKVLCNKQPMHILDLINRDDLDWTIEAALTVKEWRILRFACERAKENI